MVGWCGMAIACSYPIFDHGTPQPALSNWMPLPKIAVCVIPVDPNDSISESFLSSFLFHIKLFNIVQASDML